jgi:hypothetical protein
MVVLVVVFGVSYSQDGVRDVGRCHVDPRPGHKARGSQKRPYEDGGCKTAPSVYVVNGLERCW